MNTNDRLMGGAVLFACLFALIVGFVVIPWLLMLAWNAFVPAVLGGPVITFWQAFALYILVSILTSGLRRARS
ncbi:MAG TPA: hypothetical protein VLA89_06960 [Gemmatimonadales bacterium]|nr:hypothetical protein [Gemmatimonadales bacterium]